VSESENVALVRLLMDAYQRDDLDAQLAVLDQDVELVEWPSGPDPRTYRGHAGVVQAYESWLEAWDSLDYDVKEVVDNGDRVFVAIQMRAKGRGSAIEIDAETFNVFTLRERLITKGQFFTDRQQAFVAAGLQAPEPEGAINQEAR
jgi:ketosteroid isomerase-like protein